MDARLAITEALAKASVSAGLEIGVGGVSLEHTDDFAHGDYASGIALKYAKQAGVAPRALAEKIVAALESIEGVEKIEIAGPGFINFHLSVQELAQAIEKADKDDMWGANASLAGKKIMVEYTDPNPFKEFHIGHLMSNAIGESISRLLQFSGAEVKRANYQGDVGPHVAKAIWGIERHGLDEHDAAALGRAYAAGAQAYDTDEQAKKEIDAINTKIYDKSDEQINRIYAGGRAASLAHFDDLYEVLGTKFDLYFFESETAPRGERLVLQHPLVFERSGGALVYRGEQDGLHTRVFITSRGLPTYEAKELGLAEQKAEVWKFDESITVTAHEQQDYFAVVFGAMRRILPDIARRITHVSHGMMRFAEGKMSSRTGNVITGESLLADVADAAGLRAVQSRAENAKKLARQIAVGAIKYQILKQASGKDIIFDRERALSLDGDSGPYLQYAHARAHQVVEKAKAEGVALQIPQGDAFRLPTTADTLARLLHRFPEAVLCAADEREPHLLTNYLLQLAAVFNSWYAQVHIVDGTPAAPHKVALTDAVRRTLKNGLWMLGIPAPEKM